MGKKQSYLSNMFGDETYETWMVYSRVIIAVGTLILAVLYVLSYFFHSGIVKYLLMLTTGTSLLFIAYIAMWVLLLDIKVYVDVPEQKLWEKPKKVSKPITYKFSTIWTIILVIFGIFAIYFSNKYRNKYAFECDTFLVDKQSHLYHLEWTECEIANNAESLEKLQGYQIGNNYSLCEECKDIEEEAGPD